MGVLEHCGYLKIYRSILEWEWYSDINTFRLFLHLLLKANWKDGNFKGTKIERGSLVSSIGRLVLETGLTEQEIKTALKHLKKTGEVTSKATNKYTVFTVIKYNQYQADNQQTNEQLNNEQLTNNQQITTIEESKKERREEGKKDLKDVSANKHFIPPTVENVMGYCQEKGYSIDAEKFVDFYASKGWMIGKNKMKDWKASVRNWNRSEKSKGGKVNEQVGEKDKEPKQPTNAIVEAFLGEEYS